jgi:hypothetical protein
MLKANLVQQVPIVLVDYRALMALVSQQAPLNVAQKIMLGEVVTAQALCNPLLASEVTPSGGAVISNGFQFKAVSVRAVLGN